MSTDITDKDVAAYLSAHPDFFLKRENLLLKLKVPHDKKGTISLVEKQVDVLRDRQKKSRKQLTDFVAAAERNMEIFDNSRQLVLRLMSANRRSEFFNALEKSMRRDFGCKAYSLIVFGKPRQINHYTSRVSKGTARTYVGSLLKSRQPTLGVLRPEAQDFLFRHQSAHVKSAAVLPVREKNKQIALLAFGNEDADYFRADMDTLFISFIADALAKLLPRHLPR